MPTCPFNLVSGLIFCRGTYPLFTRIVMLNEAERVGSDQSVQKQSGSARSTTFVLPSYPRSVQWNGVMTLAPVSPLDDRLPASLASLCGSTSERGRMYSSCEWSKWPRTRTRLYSRSFSSWGLKSRRDWGKNEQKYSYTLLTEIHSRFLSPTDVNVDLWAKQTKNVHLLKRKRDRLCCGEPRKLVDQIHFPLPAFHLHGNKRPISDKRAEINPVSRVVLGTVDELPAMSQGRRWWQGWAAGTTWGTSLLLSLHWLPSSSAVEME